MLDGTDKLYALDAEQAVLGALLYQNNLSERLREIVGEDDFYEPVYGRIWRSALALIDRGEHADAISLGRLADADAGLSALGGKRHLVDLMAAAASPTSASDYARYIAELSERRGLVAIAQRLAFSAADTTEPLGLVRDWLDESLTPRVTPGSGARVISMQTAVADAMERIKGAVESGYPEGTVLTGVATLDEALGGMRRKHFALIASFYGIGKSLVANLMAIGAATGAGGQEPVRVLYVGTEMDGAENAIRMAAADINAAYSDIETANLGDEQLKALTESFRRLSALPITFREGGGLTPTDLRRLIRSEARLAHDLALGLVIVDPVSFLEIPGVYDETQWGNEVAKELKAIASETNLPLAAFHHIKKLDERKDHRPMPGDVRGSGRWLDCANEVVLLHRDAYWAAREPEPETDDADPAKEELKLAKHRKWKKRCDALEMEVLVAKRRGGPTGWRTIGCNVRTGRFWDLGEQPRLQLVGDAA